MLLQTSVTLLIVFGGITVERAITPVEDQWDHYIAHIVQRENLLLSIKSDFGYGGVIHNFKNYVIRANKDKYLPRLQDNFTDLNHSIDEYKGLENVVQTELDYLQEISQTVHAYQQAVQTTTKLINNGKSIKDIDKVVKIDDSPAFKAFSGLEDSFSALREQTEQAFHQKIVYSQTQLFWSILVTILFVNSVMLFLASSLSRRIINISETILSIENTNDLGLLLKVQGKDELTQLSSSFNLLMAKLSQLIIGTIKSATAVSTQTTLQANHIDGMVKNSQNQHTEIDMVATAMNEMSATVNEVSQNTSLAADSAHKAHVEAASGQKVMEGMLSAMDTLQQRIESAAGVIRQLETSSDQISSVLAVISAISDQTNLLALNAAIEAARAGEHGRGFAVVADEVRGLAGRTQSSTNEIRTMIDDLSAKVQSAVQVMQYSQQDTEASSEKAIMAGSALDLIINEITTINDMSTQIATAAEEQTHVAEEMNRNILNINGIAESGQQKANATLAATVHINEKVDDLRIITNKFKVSDVGVELEQAKAAHLAWYAKLRSYLDGKGGLTKDQAVSHHDCMLGKWYYSDGLEHFSHIAEMKQIEEPHAELHQLIRQIMALKEKGQTEQAEQAFLQVGPLSETIVGLIDRVQQQIAKN